MAGRAAAVSPPAWLEEIYPHQARPLREAWERLLTLDDVALFETYVATRDDVRMNVVAVKTARSVRASLGRAKNGLYLPHVLLTMTMAIVRGPAAEGSIRAALRVPTRSVHAARLAAELGVLAARSFWSVDEVRAEILLGAHASHDDPRLPPSLAHALGAAVASRRAITLPEIDARVDELIAALPDDLAAVWVVIAARWARDPAREWLAEIEARLGGALATANRSAWLPLTKQVLAAMRRWTPRRELR